MYYSPMPVKRIAVDRNAVIEAIRQAAQKLGRQPRRKELPRIAGISYSALLAHFPSIRDALLAAGVEPTQRGWKIPDHDLVADWKRVTEKLGHPPNMTEYVRHGKYSIATFSSRFGKWSSIAGALQRSRVVVPSPRPRPRGPRHMRFSRARVEEPLHPSPQKAPPTGRTELLPAPQLESQHPHEGDKAIAMQWAASMPALPGELAGKRRVTDAVCAMIINTLMGDEAGLKWQRFMMSQGSVTPGNFGTPGNSASGDNLNSLACADSDGNALTRVNSSVPSGGVINDDLPIMGPPFYPCALANAPVNETGVMLLFGMLAGELGFQIEAVQGRYPDIEAKRQIQPGKWQRVRIEAEYESRNFTLHGHNPADCEIIVCWRHNWVNCPKHIEVIELSKVVAAL